MVKNFILTCFFYCVLIGCNSKKENSKQKPIVGFLDFVEDATLAQAKQGFFDALTKSGYSEKDSTIEIIYQNAQGDQPTLLQACDLLISKKVDLIAANTTLATITSVQRSKDLPSGKVGIPVCMMVAPRPDIAGLTDKNGNAPKNLFGVYETLEYIDTSIALIKQLKPGAKIIGTIYNQSEPQSRDAFNQLEKNCKRLGLQLVSVPVNNSSESQLATQSLLTKKPDVFFALPDNVIFASFETILKSCNESKVPIFTSEAGLVSRGAVASYGADFYLWGYQAGEQAGLFLREKTLANLKPEIVKVRKRVLNKTAANIFGIVADSTFTLVN
ncbi:MAG TPA: ABC transporter substrate-binding protein [Bacteroidia bacterium]|nr:ABC transporter substrate-binding protein [Bacteroidia bacterium]